MKRAEEGTKNSPDEIIIPMSEVARRTGWSKRSLIDDCKAGVIDYTERKGSYGLTPAQLDALIERHTFKATVDPRSAQQREVDELAAAREFNARSGRSQGRAA